MAERQRTSIVVGPRSVHAPFGALLARWLEAGIAGHGKFGGLVTGRAALVVVPEYLRTGARTVLTDLSHADWSSTVVAVVGYGGRLRGRRAIEDAREVITVAGAHVLGPSLGLDTAQVRARGFERADVLLRDLLLDRLADEAALLESS